MSSELNSSLTSIDWLPQLGMGSLRSGRERTGGAAGGRDGRKDRGRERGDFVAPVPEPSPSNCKGKPPHSYATLITMAIAAAPERKLSLNDIYTWISNTFPYYSRAGRGWKVSTQPSCQSSVGCFNVIYMRAAATGLTAFCPTTELHSSQSVSEQVLQESSPATE